MALAVRAMPQVEAGLLHRGWESGANRLGLTGQHAARLVAGGKISLGGM